MLVWLLIIFKSSFLFGCYDFQNLGIIGVMSPPHSTPMAEQITKFSSIPKMVKSIVTIRAPMPALP